MNRSGRSQEELHRAQAEERRRQDRQLLHEQLLKQNWDLRKAHEKSLNEMEELKKFQSSTFDTIARRRLVEDQDAILELTGEIQEANVCFEIISLDAGLRMDGFPTLDLWDLVIEAFRHEDFACVPVSLRCSSAHIQHLDKIALAH